MAVGIAPPSPVDERLDVDRLGGGHEPHRLGEAVAR
jgi:hypothetical protein